MIRKILVLVIFFIITSFNTVDDTVYICGPQGAKKYHYSETCRGLNACNHEVVKVSKSKAQSFGLTLCGWED
ncbi:hypothetical protein [Flavobacterium sp.]|uniref:hypothetical protein n=1 Tax=Flavobacterium sp. TaxID=239 RepID=UPI00286BEC3D|nr:hypothetical protein [Flavobacterium sp.]